MLQALADLREDLSLKAAERGRDQRKLSRSAKVNAMLCCCCVVKW